MEKRIKVMFFIDSYRIGGMHKQVYYIVKHIDRTRFEPVMCTSTSDGGLREDYKATNCKMIDLEWKGRFDMGVITKLRQTLKLEKPDLIFITEAQNLIYYRLSAFFLKSKTIQIGSFRGLTFWLGHEKLIYQYLDNLLAKLLYRTSKHVVVNSLELKEHYSRVIRTNHKNPIQVIFNGCEFNFPITKSRVDIESELKLSSNCFIIIMVARLDPWKDFYTLLEAAEIITATNKKAKFLLLGDGSMRAEIETIIKKKKLEESIFLLGERKDVFNYINASDISVLSTHGEGFSNALMESMALGKPVIATNVGGNLTVIGGSGESGFLIPPKSPKEFVDAINLLINNEEKRRIVGIKGQERIYSICSIQKYISDYENLFQAAICVD
jgi:glycosyltransferase involved in cell wall biosynthesis